MKKPGPMTAVLLLCLAGTLVISSCDLVLKQLGELPERSTEDETKGEKRGRGVPPAPAEQPTAAYEKRGLQRGDEAWEPELFVIPTEEAGGEKPEERVPSFFSPEEELWIITKAPVAEKQHREKTVALSAVGTAARTEGTSQSETRFRTDVKAIINGMISSVTVSQSFQNPTADYVDIPYQCRLPSNATVADLVMSIGSRRIRGIVREREEAEEIYELARSRGLLASLVQQETPSALRLTITHVAPNEEIDVSVNYVHTLTFADGALEFILPLAPPASYADVMPQSISDDQGGSDHQQYVRFDDEERPFEISAEVQIDAGVPIHTISSPSHTILIDQPTAQQAMVHMRDVCEAEEQTLVIRFGVAGENPVGALFTERRDSQGYFALTLFPPGEGHNTSRVPMDLIFLIDCSKSMKGKAVYRAKQFVSRAVQQLESSDAFKIVTFAGATWPKHEDLAPATSGNIRQASRYLEGLPVRDGEGMLPGLEVALTTPHRTNRLPGLVVITDGYIGNDVTALSYLDTLVAQTRVFCIGIGTSVNTYLLEDMAMSGRGGVVYLPLDADATDAANTFIGAVGRPAMTDITIDWGSMEIDEALPRQIPDLFAGRSVLLMGTYRGALPSTLRVSGRVGERQIVLELPVDSDEPHIARPGVSVVWARKRISELIRQAMMDPSTDVLSLGKRLSVEHRIASPFASFIIVDTKSGN